MRARGHRKSLVRGKDSDSNQPKTTLGERSALHHHIFEHNLDALLLTAPDGRVFAANQAACQMFGRSEEEICRVGRSGLVDENDPRLPTLLEERARTGKARGKLRLLRKDGTRFEAEVHSMLFDTPDGPRTSMIIRDVTEQKRAEEALRQSEQRFSMIFEKAPFAAALSSLPHGVIEAVNEEFENMFGFSRQEAVGKTSLELGLYPDPDARRQAASQVGERGYGRNAELRLRTKSGEARDFLVNTDYVEIGEEKHILITAQDITQRKQAEAQLRLEQERLNAFLSNSAVLAWMKDEDGRHVFLSRNYEKRYQVRFEDFQGKTDYEIWSAEIADVFRQNDLAVLASGGSIEVVEEASNPDGSRSWWLNNKFVFVDEKGKRYIGGMGVDITERKRAEEKLERQNRRLKALREIDTAILAADSVESIVGAALDHIRELIECRRASLMLIDWETGEALLFDVKMEDKTFMPKGTRIPLAVSQDMLPILAKNQPVLINDLTALPDPPPQFQMGIKEGFRSVCVLPLFAQNNLIGAFNMSSEMPGFFDEERVNLGHEVANQVAIAITQNNLLEELRKLNAELEGRVRERTAQLQAANRELEAFTYSVSHDLRAPLRAVHGFSQALLNRYSASLDEQGRHYLNRIQQNTSRMGELIDDLLSLARLARRELKQDVVDLSALAREVAAELIAQEPGRQVMFEIEDQLQGRGDAGLIRIVVQNLLGNAWKFTSTRAQAQINFGLAPSAPTPLPQGEGRRDEGETIYCIRDNGVGFDMAYADKLFGAFQRLHSEMEFQGTGIGLATVQRIIHRHGGRIWAEAEPDKGAAFYFTLG